VDPIQPPGRCHTNGHRTVIRIAGEPDYSCLSAWSGSQPPVYECNSHVAPTVAGGRSQNSVGSPRRPRCHISYFTRALVRGPRPAAASHQIMDPQLRARNKWHPQSIVPVLLGNGKLPHPWLIHEALPITCQHIQSRTGPLGTAAGQQRWLRV
jgi:hypothetical protein